jgi:hypothetical protein
MEFDMSIEGLDELYEILNMLKGLEYLTPPMRQTVFLLQERISKYPPAKPTSRRDGTLGKEWTTKVQLSGDTLEGKVGTNIIYAPWVQSSRFQAWMHKEWWQTDEDVMRASVSDIEHLFNTHIANFLSRYSTS